MCKAGTSFTHYDLGVEREVQGFAFRVSQREPGEKAEVLLTKLRAVELISRCNPESLVERV